MYRNNSSSSSSPQTDHCSRQRGNWNVEVLNLLHCFFFSAHWGEQIVRSKERGYSNLPGNLQFYITEEAIRQYIFLLTLQSEEFKLSAQISHQLFVTNSITVLFVQLILFCKYFFTYILPLAWWMSTRSHFKLVKYGSLVSGLTLQSMMLFLSL